MKTDRNFKILYCTAYDFMTAEIGKEALEDKLDHYRNYKVQTFQDLFWHLIYSLTNKVGMRATIGDIDTLATFLFDFDPQCTCNHYGDDWATLFKGIKSHHTPPGPMNIQNESSFWVIFCKGILSGAAFLSEFETPQALDQFVQSFAHHDLAIPALPMAIEQEVYGMGFPLACDWLSRY